MLPTPVLFAEAHGDTPQVELREHNPFASRSTVTLPAQGEAGCDAEWDPLRASGSLLKDPRRVCTDVLEWQVSLRTATDHLGSPVKGPSMEMQSDAEVGKPNANLRVRNNSV